MDRFDYCVELNQEKVPTFLSLRGEPRDRNQRIDRTVPVGTLWSGTGVNHLKGAVLDSES